MNFNKHNYIGEHRGKANILLTATIDDEFSITLKDEQDEVKSSWEMTMHREDAEKVIRKAAEMLGVIPKGEWKHIGGDEWVCSECGHVITTEGSWEKPLSIGAYHCENCGAKMNGGAE